MCNNNYNAGTATMTAGTAQAGYAGAAVYGADAAGAAGAMYGEGTAEGLGRQKLGLIVAGITQIIVLLFVILDSYTSFFSADGVAEVIGVMLLGAWMIGILASYFLTGFFRCLRRMGRLMFSGFYFPVWPINFFAGLVTFILVGAFAIAIPVLFPALVYFEK